MTDENGRTPLHAAVAAPADFTVTNVTHLLLVHGAKPEVNDVYKLKLYTKP